MKFDEIIEQERAVKDSMMSRAGVLGLMLHSTINHDLERHLQQQNAAAAAQRKQQQLKLAQKAN